MSIPIMTISERPEDLAFGGKIARAVEQPFHAAKNAKHIKEILSEFPQTLIFWDADSKAYQKSATGWKAKQVDQFLQELTRPEKVFAMTSDPLIETPYLKELSCYGHHIQRRFEGPAMDLFIRLMNAALVSHPFGIDRYFPEGTKVNRVVVTQSGHRRTAVQAVENVLNKNGLEQRLSGMVSQAVDEMLLNAIFDAPVDKEGLPIRRGKDLTEEFHLDHPKDQVILEFAVGEEYMAISVSDGFGSLKKDVLMSILHRNYRKEDYRADPTSPHAGLGLNGIVQYGLSLLFVTEKGRRTQGTVFFPKTKSFRTFRTGFRFLTLLTE